MYVIKEGTEIVAGFYEEELSRRFADRMALRVECIDQGFTTRNSVFLSDKSGLIGFCNRKYLPIIQELYERDRSWAGVFKEPES